MSRSRIYSIQGKTVALIWIISAVLFVFLFRMATLNSQKSGSLMSYVDQRNRIYDKMSRDLDENGATFLKGGQTSQSLSLSDIFTIEGGTVRPILKAANPPVRAIVLHLSSEFSIPISQVVKTIFLPYFQNAIWFQNTSLYHFSMFHASHHLSPVIATDIEIQAEADAIGSVAKAICPLKIVLDRVLLTSTGVLLGCWQVISGTDPFIIRSKLKSALPNASPKQLYDPAMLHTSLARLLGPPTTSQKDTQGRLDELDLFHKLVSRVNRDLRGFEATVSELYFVEEFDVLALALDGRTKIRQFQLSCPVN